MYASTTVYSTGNTSSGSIALSSLICNGQQYVPAQPTGPFINNCTQV